MTEKEKIHDALTPKQTLFVNEYVQSWNAAKAARVAGYKGDDFTVGYNTLRNPKVAAMIKDRLEEYAMPAFEALARLAQIARASVSDFLIYDPETGDFHISVSDDIPVEQALLAVKKIKVHIDGKIELEMYDKLRALELIGKHFRLFADIVEAKSDIELRNKDGQPFGLVILPPKDAPDRSV